jgi:hypothetical protein
LASASVTLNAASQEPRVHGTVGVRQSITVDHLKRGIEGTVGLAKPLDRADDLAGDQEHADGETDKAGQGVDALGIKPTILAIGDQAETGLDDLLELGGPDLIEALGVRRKKAPVWYGVQAELRADDTVFVQRHRAVSHATVADGITATRIGHRLGVVDDLIGRTHRRRPHRRLTAEFIRAFKRAAVKDDCRGVRHQ